MQLPARWTAQLRTRLARHCPARSAAPNNTAPNVGISRTLLVKLCIVPPRYGAAFLRMPSMVPDLRHAVGSHVTGPGCTATWLH